MGRETRAFIYTHICVYKHIIDATRERERGGKYKKKIRDIRTDQSIVDRTRTCALSKPGVNQMLTSKIPVEVRISSSLGFALTDRLNHSATTTLFLNFREI